MDGWMDGERQSKIKWIDSIVYPFNDSSIHQSNHSSILYFNSSIHVAP